MTKNDFIADIRDVTARLLLSFLVIAASPIFGDYFHIVNSVSIAKALAAGFLSGAVFKLDESVSQYAHVKMPKHEYFLYYLGVIGSILSFATLSLLNQANQHGLPRIIASLIFLFTLALLIRYFARMPFRLLKAIESKSKGEDIRKFLLVVLNMIVIFAALIEIEFI